MKNNYILDTSSIQYMLEILPHKLMEDLWNQFEIQCKNGRSISDRETKKALDTQLTEIDSLEWVNQNSIMFKTMTQNDATQLGELVNEGIFDYYNNSLELIRKLPVSIPFIISMAISQKRVLVIDKRSRDKQKIVEICSQKDIKYVDVEEYLLNIKKSIV